MSASTLKSDPFAARDTFDTGSGSAGIYRLSKLEDLGLTQVDALPFSIRILLESLLRNCDGYVVSEDDVRKILGENLLRVWDEVEGHAAAASQAATTSSST